MTKWFFYLNIHIMPFYFILFQVTYMNWTGKNHAFIGETFINDESVSATQRELRVNS